MRRKLIIAAVCGVIFSLGGAVSVRFLPESANAASDLAARPVLVCGGAYADTPTSADESCFSTCGGEIPWPFQVSNQTVELADGEKYVLMGRVELKDGAARFVVDLERHPWLANARRKMDPSYPLSGDVASWEQYDGKLIQLRAQAKWAVRGHGASASVVIALSSLAEPAVMRDGSNHDIRSK